jgi:hypothetical protein
LTTSDLQPRVELGERVYRELTWTRKDTVYLGSIKIGYIHSSREDRQGRTVSSFDGKSIKGRNINWCANKALPFVQTEENTLPA